MENKIRVSKGIIIFLIVIVILVIGIVSGAFYIHSSQEPQILEDTLSGGNISLTYTDDENLFFIENAVPTNDLIGTEFDSADMHFDFTVSTVIDAANFVEYEIILVKDTAVSTALDNNIKIYLEQEKSGTYSQVVKPTLFDANVKDNNILGSAMSIYKQKKTATGKDNYRLRMWVSDTAVINEGDIQNFGVKILIRGIGE